MIIGIDGGGGKTAGALADPAGRLLARVRGPASAIVGVPSPAAAAVIRSVCRELCARAGVAVSDVAAVGFGLSGIDFEDEHAAQVAAVAEALEVPAERLVLVNDGIPALWGATDAPAAAIIQHGSGYTAAWRSRPGGETLFDHLSAGGPVDLRAELPAAIARVIDGRLPETPLLAAALQHYGVGKREVFAEQLYRGRISWERRTTVVPLICAAWQAGDPVATALVERAAADYAQAGAVLLTRAGAPAAPLALGGGIFRHAPASFIEHVAERVRALRPGAVVTRPRLPPELGAVLMAAHHAGLATAPLFAEIAKQEPA